VFTTEALGFKQIVTAAAHVLVANQLPNFRLRDLLLDMNKDWRVRLLANVSDSLIASFFHDESTNTILMSASTCAARPCASCSICSTLWE